MKYLTYVFITGLMLLVIACGVSTADVDATVEVSLEEQVVETVNTAKTVSTTAPKPVAINVVEPEEIIYEGKLLYLANCVTCHGVNLQGNPNWRSGTDKDGQRLPPPLNGTGHTWHHSPGVLSQIIKYGLKIYDENYEGKMAGNENLTDKEIYSLLEYITSVWSEELRTSYTETYK
jgi:mono/diheme cytochrome c family protein